MARVVRRSATNWYLLGMFVFLFMISAILAAVFYNGQADLIKQKKDADEASQRAADREKMAVRDIGEAFLKVIGEKNVSAKVVEEMCKDALKLPYCAGSQDLTGALKSLSTLAAAKDKEIQDLKGRGADLTKENDALQQSVKQVTDRLNADVATAKKTAQDATVKVDSVTKDADVRLAELQKEKTAALEGKDKEIGEKVTQVDVLGKEIQLKDNVIAKLMSDWRQSHPQVKVGEVMLRKPDGKIAKTLLDGQTCYIDLGERDHVMPGLPFSVYAARTGIPEDGKPKAKIVIVNLGGATSECRITEFSKDDPIMDGDLIANFIFNPSRTYNFVVEGQFDLYANGKPEADSTRQVEQLIEGFGGKVQQELAPTSDFVVMGEEPPLPPKPADEAPPAQFQIYNEKKKQADRYRQIKTLAQSMQIPVLNTSRFLAFTGFVPKKRVVE